MALKPQLRRSARIENLENEGAKATLQPAALSLRYDALVLGEAFMVLSSASLTTN
jgi:hypothetical protein